MQTKPTSQRLFFVLIFNFFCCLDILAQNQGDEQLFFGMGYGIHSTPYTEWIGEGFAYNLGLQKSLNNPNYRWTPNLQLGFYHGKNERDSPDVYFNSASVNLDLHHDFIRFKKGSLVLGLGLSLGYISGLQGKGGKSCCLVPDTRDNRYFSGFVFGMNNALGLRYHPKKHWGVEVYIFHVRSPFGDKYIDASTPQIRFIYRLRRLSQVPLPSQEGVLE